MLALASPEQSKKIDNEQKAQPKAIRDFDLLLAEMHKNPGKIKELNKNIRKIVTRSGHPMGFYMSQKIMKHAGRESLVKVVRNPFKFFYLYNKVCKEHDDGPIFSDNALARIKTLEKKYTIKN